MYLAVLKQEKAVVELLLRDGANAEATFSAGKTALYSAVTNRCHDIVQLLLDHGARLDALSGMFVLADATIKGDTEMVRLLRQPRDEASTSSWAF